MSLPFDYRMDEEVDVEIIIRDKWHVRTRVGDYIVSTVDLYGKLMAAKLSARFDALPNRYETMVKHRTWGYLDNVQERYGSEEDARRGHAVAVASIRDSLGSGEEE